MNSTVVAACVITVGSTMYVQVIRSNGKGYTFTLTPIIGGFIMGIFLLAVNAASPVLARDFSILIIIGALLVNGTTIFQSITRKGY